MPIDPNAVGTEFGPTDRSWDSKDCLLYAVGIGAGTDELEFTTENSAGIDQKVFPTFATIVGQGAGFAMRGNIGSYNPAMLVHAEQGITLYNAIPFEGSVQTAGKVVGIWDKGSGALVATEALTVDAKTGDKLFSNYSSLFIRGEGGWGGDRGPSGAKNVAPDRDSDHSVSYETLPQQALVYRLSGDRNPLHSDPQFAAAAGFDRPIIHGLCTYGFTGRALLHTLCGSDPQRFRSMNARFTKPAWPGDTLTVKMWVNGNEAIFRTETGRGDVVIDQGLFTFDS
jgi:acyl dehydratase